jgi:hypothetical protein
MGADIHVVHSHLPDPVAAQGGKVVWIGHGTPEHCFQQSMELGLNQGYGAGDSFMLGLHWLQNADALVTFWPRHKAIYDSMLDKGRSVNCIPLGVDRDFWKAIPSNGKFAGSPSIFTAENCHYIKWPLDLITAWPWVFKEVLDARLHINYLPRDQHRWWFPLMFRNGTAYSSFSSANMYDHEALRNCFVSTDYYIGLVRYGDFNRICLEAKASGSKLISYIGNPYADFWVTEGDQRTIAQQLTGILKGEVEPRETQAVPSINETAEAMLEIYKGIL